MTYVGQQPATTFDSGIQDRFTGLTTNTVTLNHEISAEEDILVVWNNIVQDKNTYSVGGTGNKTVTLGGTLVSADVVTVYYLNKVLQSVNPTAGSVGITELNVSDGSSGQALTTNGSGTLSFATVGSSSITDNGNANAITIDSSENVNLTQNLTLVDDKGIVFGTGSDWMIGAAAGESTLEVFAGSDNSVGANEGQIQFKVGDSAESYILVSSGEGNTSLSTYYIYGDQGDDSDDTWRINANQGSCGIDVGMNTLRQNIVFDGNGNGYADATWQDNTWDYAELFPWKTPLSNDGDINALWGKSVVLDGDFVRIAETGEEAKVIGVVRPKGSTSSHGDGLQWQGKWKKDVWGNYETENYTRVTWQENGYRHSYPKDRIPTHRLKKSVCEDKDIHKKESSFELDKNGNKIPVVVPNTAEEKTATNYLERTHKKGKADVPLKRRIYSDSYNPATAYNRREDRPKEWVLIGMLGQVPVRDSAIIPTHWKKMKNLESGIDKYFIFNK